MTSRRRRTGPFSRLSIKSICYLSIAGRPNWSISQCTFSCYSVLCWFGDTWTVLNVRQSGKITVRVAQFRHMDRRIDDSVLDRVGGKDQSVFCDQIRVDGLRRIPQRFDWIAAGDGQTTGRRHGRLDVGQRKMARRPPEDFLRRITRRESGLGIGPQQTSKAHLVVKTASMIDRLLFEHERQGQRSPDMTRTQTKSGSLPIRQNSVVENRVRAGSEAALRVGEDSRRLGNRPQPPNVPGVRAERIRSPGPVASSRPVTGRPSFS